jgi:ribose-phosphate pyrophosphokinase
MKKEDLRLIVLDNIDDFGSKTNDYLKEVRETNEDYIIPITRDRFSNGEGKIKIGGTVRDKDIYIISDVGNYNVTYNMHGFTHHMSPDEHFQDIKRVISAISGYASKITLVMPLLYESRQHKRKGKESLDCAIALKELEALGVNHIVTFDAHDPNVANAIPNLPFENFYPTHDILTDLVTNEDINNLLVVSPDMGAMERARYYAEMLGSDVGVFYKRRDLSKVVDGKNPIVEHVYMGADVKGKNIIVVDDMIASGSSMIEVASLLKEKGANKIYFVATFALLTEGPDAFIKAYNEGLFNKLYTTNLSYVSEVVKKETWYQEVDCSSRMANIINALNNKESLKPLFNGKQEILDMVKEKNNK